MAGLPIVILAGSDRRATRLPESGRDQHPLTGYKGVDIRIGGRPIAAIVAERLAACVGLGPVYLAGPASVFEGEVAPAELIEADGTFAGNIRRALDHVGAAHPGAPVAFTVCDIIPEVQTLNRLLIDYGLHAPCDLWFPMVQAPHDPRRLGESAWKPVYRVVLAPGEPAVRVLPGHLAIADPAALRIDFFLRLLEVGYRTRNRSIAYRSAVMVRELLGGLVGRDLRLLLTGRAPTLTWTVAGAGLGAARQLRRGTITRQRLEQALRRIAVTRAHRRSYPDRRVLTPVVEGLSLALDIDTVEEARQYGATYSPPASGSAS